MNDELQPARVWRVCGADGGAVSGVLECVWVEGNLERVGPLIARLQRLDFV